MEEVGVGKVFAFAAVYIVWYAKAIPFCMSKVIPFCMCEGLCEKNVQYEKVRRPVPYPQRVEEVGVGKVYLVSLQSILFGMRKLYPFVCRKLLSFHVKNYTFLYVVFWSVCLC